MTIEAMSSKAAREALNKTEKRLAVVQGRIDEIQPPPKPMGATGPQPVGAPRFDMLSGSGAEYRRIVEDGDDPAALATLVREHEELIAERTMLYARRDKLRYRVRDATDEEAKAQAPADEKRHAKALPAIAEKVQAAREAFDEARAELETHMRGLKAAREITGNVGPALDLDDWITVEAAARLRLTDERPQMLRAHNAAGMYVGESGKMVDYPALPLDLLGEPDAPSLWPKWLRVRENMTPRERASSLVPNNEDDVRRVAREIARKALTSTPPDREAFHNAWGTAEEIVAENKKKDEANAKRRRAAERQKAKGESWLASSKSKLGT